MRKLSSNVKFCIIIGLLFVLLFYAVLSRTADVKYAYEVGLHNCMVDYIEKAQSGIVNNSTSVVNISEMPKWKP